MRLGSPVEYVAELEEEAGWTVRFLIIELLRYLRRDKDLDVPQRKFLNYTLSEPAVVAALQDNLPPSKEHQSSLDELFVRSQRFRNTRHFAEAVEFIAKFQEYSPYNNMLVFLQNPLTTCFATASHWRKIFHRTIKEEARPMIILAPRTPVLLVYDISDTEGPKLPQKLEQFSKVSGRFDPLIFRHTVKNCEQDHIQIERKPMGQLRAGFAVARLRNSQYQIRITLREELEEAAAYFVLCHELAHVYLGHLGASRQSGWPYRLKLSDAVAEIEAEAVAYTVCRRAGLSTRSAEYLSSFVGEQENIEAISLDLITRVAGRIEEMGRRLSAPNS